MQQTISKSEMLDRDILDNPYPFYQKLCTEAPVWHVPDSDIFVVSSHRLVTEVTERTEDFSSHLLAVICRGEDDTPSLFSLGGERPQILATADGPDHTHHRRLLAPFFAPRRLSALSEEITRMTDSAIETAMANKTIDFMTAVAHPIPITVVNRLIGFRNADPAMLLNAAFDSTATVGGTLTLNQLVETGLRTLDIFEWIVRQLESAPVGEDCLLSKLKQEINTGNVDTGTAAGMLHTLLSAGGESTSSLIGNAVRLLCEDQALQRNLREDLDGIPAFLEEVLRYESPFRSHLRSVPRDTWLGGVLVPAGATLLLNWSAANRDPAVFDQAGVVDLQRGGRHLAFGRGVHMCLGAPLARLEARIVVQRLLEASTCITLQPNDPPRWVESLQVRRHARLPVTLTPA